LEDKYIIQDWTGKRLFANQTFDTFEDAWDFIYENVPDEGEDTYDEYYVEGR
jgi:hypothetical protein